MSAKDPFQILADELTLIRKDMDKLQRTSLDRGEAKALNELVVQAVSRMEHMAKEAPRAVRAGIQNDLGAVTRTTEQAAARAAEKAMDGLRGDLEAERRRYAQSAGEARREAWRYFGGFWVWLAAMLATGAFLGLLAAHVTETGRTLFRISDIVRYGCDWSTVGGTVIEQDNGSSWCGFWIVTPEEAQERREQEQEN